MDIKMFFEFYCHYCHTRDNNLIYSCLCVVITLFLLPRYCHLLPRYYHIIAICSHLLPRYYHIIAIYSHLSPRYFQTEEGTPDGIWDTWQKTWNAWWKSQIDASKKASFHPFLPLIPKIIQNFGITIPKISINFGIRIFFLIFVPELKQRTLLIIERVK